MEPELQKAIIGCLNYIRGGNDDDLMRPMSI